METGGLGAAGLAGLGEHLGEAFLEAINIVAEFAGGAVVSQTALGNDGKAWA